MAWAREATEVYNGKAKRKPTYIYFRLLSNYANLIACVQYILYVTLLLISWSIILYKQLLQQAGRGILQQHINITQGNQDERITYVQYLARRTC